MLLNCEFLQLQRVQLVRIIFSVQQRKAFVSKGFKWTLPSSIGTNCFRGEIIRFAIILKLVFYLFEGNAVVYLIDEGWGIIHLIDEGWGIVHLIDEGWGIVHLIDEGWGIIHLIDEGWGIVHLDNDGAGVGGNCSHGPSIDLPIFWNQILSVISDLPGVVLVRGECSCIEVGAVQFVFICNINRFACSGAVDMESRKIFS